MKRRLIRFANWGHRHESTFVRRSSVTIAILGLGCWTIAFWLFVVVWTPIYPILEALKGFVIACYETPRLTMNQARNDAADWSANISGALRIWRNRKVVA